MKNLITYHIDGVEHYLLYGEPITAEALTALREKYYKKGYEERMVGYYDKFYRYNTFDSGTSYDRGVMDAAAHPDCVPDCTIIEYNTMFL